MLLLTLKAYLMNNKFTPYTPEQVLRGNIKGLEARIEDIIKNIENARQSIAEWEPELIELEKALERFQEVAGRLETERLAKKSMEESRKDYEYNIRGENHTVESDKGFKIDSLVDEDEYPATPDEADESPATPDECMEVKYWLDLSDEGHWLIGEGYGHDVKKYPAGYNKQNAILLIDHLNKANRPNLKVEDGTLYVCFNDHHRSDCCSWGIGIQEAFKVISEEEEYIDYCEEWDENQRRGYRAYLRAKKKGYNEKQALSISFEYAQPGKQEEYQ